MKKTRRTLLIYNLSLFFISFANAKASEQKIYFVDVFKKEILETDDKHAPPPKKRVNGVLGQYFKKVELPLEKMSLITNKGPEKVKYISLIDDCYRDVDPLTDEQSQNCQKVSVYEYKGRNQPLFLMSSPDKVSGVKHFVWKKGLDIDSFNEKAFKKNNLNPKIPSGLKVELTQDMLKRPTLRFSKKESNLKRTISIKDLRGNCDGFVFENWVKLLCEDVTLYFKDHQFIGTSPASKDPFKLGLPFDLKASFVMDDVEYFVFDFDEWIFGKLKVYAHRDSSFVELENSYQLYPIDAPMSP